MVNVTSAQAAKILNQLVDKLNRLKEKEELLATFNAAASENPEANRPEFDMVSYHKEMDELQKEIRTVKHAINVFNTTHIVAGFDMTVDEILIYIPQLTGRKNYLSRLVGMMPKQRVQDRHSFGSSSSIIDYVYTNFDMKDAEAEYSEVSKALSKAQLALDRLNQTERFEIDIDWEA